MQISSGIMAENQPNDLIPELPQDRIYVKSNTMFRRCSEARGDEGIPSKVMGKLNEY